MKKLILGIIPLLLLAVGCAGSAKSSENPAANSGLITLDQALSEAASRIDERIAARVKIAPLNFNSPHDKFSNYILEELTANLVDSRKLTVVDRREIDLIRNEFDFQFSGEVADDSMQRIGHMLGAQSIISGNFTDMGGFYRIMIRVLNVQSATVEVQYRANIVSDTITTALLTGGRANVTTTTSQRVTATGSQTQQVPTQTPQTPAPSPTSAVPAIAIEVTARASGTLFFQNTRVATLWDNETHTIPIENPGTYALKMVYATHEETRSVIISTRGITRVSFGAVYTIGSTGPAGGLVFYDKGSYSDGWRYLEAHTSDFTGVEWGLYGTAIGGTMAGIGDGKRNTELIVARLNRLGEQNRAAQMAASLNAGGFNDWYLPSRDELDLMYRNLKLRERGNFANVWYWSSSESDSTSIWVQHFGDGGQRSGWSYSFMISRKDQSKSARAIRRF